MRNFRRSVWFSWPYRRRLVTSIFCAMAVAVLWSVNLGAIFPVLKLIKTQENLHQWVDREIAEHQKQNATSAEEVVRLNRVLADLAAKPDTPEREKGIRRTSADLARAT